MLSNLNISRTTRPNLAKTISGNGNPVYTLLPKPHAPQKAKSIWALVGRAHDLKSRAWSWWKPLQLFGVARTAIPHCSPPPYWGSGDWAVGDWPTSYHLWFRSMERLWVGAMEKMARSPDQWIWGEDAIFILRGLFSRTFCPTKNVLTMFYLTVKVIHVFWVFQHLPSLGSLSYALPLNFPAQCWVGVLSKHALRACYSFMFCSGMKMKLWYHDTPSFPSRTMEAD